MIGRLRGRVDYKAQDHFLLDVNGVGYLVFCSERTLAEIATDGEFTTIYTDSVSYTHLTLPTILLV